MPPAPLTSWPLEHLKLDGLPVRKDDRAQLRDGGRAGELLQSALPPGQHVFPVLNAAGKLVGLVTTDELALLEAEPSLSMLVTAFDIMRPPTSVSINDSLLTALDLMRAERLPELPVLGLDGKIVGFIDETTIANAYLHESDPKSRRSH